MGFSSSTMTFIIQAKKIQLYNEAGRIIGGSYTGGVSDSARLSFICIAPDYPTVIAATARR